MTKDLGINFNIDLQWNEHHKSLTSRAYRTLHFCEESFPSQISKLKNSYIHTSIVRFQLPYCSQLWRPHLIKDIQILERVQHHAAKYILNDYVSTYKSQLITLHLLPLMYLYELNDIMFLIKSLKSPSSSFNIYNFISFTSSSTRSSARNKLIHFRSNSTPHSSFLLHNNLLIMEFTIATSDWPLSSHFHSAQ